MEIERQIEWLSEKVKQYLITMMDQVVEEASDREFYQALCYALREEIMINWSASRRTFLEKKPRTLYYLSMEYLPGRILGNNLTNLGATELVQRVLKKLGRDFRTVSECEPDPGLGNGGLGRLASCFLDSLATLQYPAMGYGLRYQYGIFDQEIWDGVQIERPDTWLLRENPWEIRRDNLATNVHYCGQPVRTANQHGDVVYALDNFEEVRALPYDTPIIGYAPSQEYSVLTLRLWTTKESPRNFQLQQFNAGQLDQAAENTALTDVLYPVDVHDTGKRIRLKQEYLLVSASLQDILRRLEWFGADAAMIADKTRIQINDTHPAMVVAEMMRLLTRQWSLSWGEAWEITRTCCSFTNHTVLKEALEEWDQSLIQYLLPRQYDIIERLNQQLCQEIRTQFPKDEERVRRLSILEEGRVKMAHLAIYGSHKVNGVAQLHTSILKSKVFPDFVELYPDRFVNVTNGVTQRRWLLHCNPDLSRFLIDRIGEGWITDFSKIGEIADYASDEKSQREFLEIKRKNKQQLIDFIHTHRVVHDHVGRPVVNLPTLTAGSLFDVQIKRIHEYKRQLLLALHTIMLYQELVENPDCRSIDRTIIVAGKAAPSYTIAKQIILLINCMARQINNDPRIGNRLRILFLENYSVSRAEAIIPAADLSEQISTTGLEASGTGNMKLAINGALTIGTDDGANVEMREQVTDRWWPFLFGHSTSELDALRRQGASPAWEIYSAYPEIRKAVDSLRDGTFAQKESEHEALLSLYNSLLEGHFGSPPDPYFVLQAIPGYYETQKKVEELYQKPLEWAEYALHNVAGMGKFSADRSIRDYAHEIWGLRTCWPDHEIIEKVRKEYRLHTPPEEMVER